MMTLLHTQASPAHKRLQHVAASPSNCLSSDGIEDAHGIAEVEACHAFKNPSHDIPKP
jgi:hypothetical protein